MSYECNYHPIMQRRFPVFFKWLEKDAVVIFITIFSLTLEGLFIIFFIERLLIEAMLTPLFMLFLNLSFVMGIPIFILYIIYIIYRREFYKKRELEYMLCIFKPVFGENIDGVAKKMAGEAKYWREKKLKKKLEPFFFEFVCGVYR